MPTDIGNKGRKMSGIYKIIPAITASLDRADVDSRDQVRNRVTLSCYGIKSNNLNQFTRKGD